MDSERRKRYEDGVWSSDDDERQPICILWRGDWHVKLREEGREQEIAYDLVARHRYDGDDKLPLWMRTRILYRLLRESSSS